MKACKQNFAILAYSVLSIASFCASAILEADFGAPISLGHV